MTPVQPLSLTYSKAEKSLRIEWNDGVRAELSAEFLRVYSPSAEVRGHSADQRVIQTGKKHVAISELQAVGNYAIRILFDDGHDTGIYSWSYLRELHDNFDAFWQNYIDELKESNASRLPTIPVGQWTPPRPS